MPISVLCGRSGVGKSAFLIRPLIWVAFNRSPGTRDSFRLWGTKQTSAELWLDTVTGYITRLRVQNFQCHADVDRILCAQSGPQIRIGRYRTNAENWYEIEMPGAAIQKLKIDKDRQPPETVRKLLNMVDVNFSSQHDPIYLLSASAPELSRTLNALGGLEKIDSTLANINERLRSDKSSAERCTKEEDRLNVQLARYNRLPDLELEAVLLEAAARTAAIARERAGQIRVYIGELSRAKAAMAEYRGLDDLAGLIASAEVADTAAKGARERAGQIAGLYKLGSAGIAELGRYKGLDKLQKVSAGLSKQLDNIVQIREKRRRAGDIRRLIARMTEAKGMLDKLEDLEALSDKLRWLVVLAEGVEDRRNSLAYMRQTHAGFIVHKESLEYAEDALREAETAWIAERGEVCALCGKPWDSEVCNAKS